MNTFLLLLASNVFMTLAWYGQLKLKFFEGKALWLVVLISWGIAFFEYCLMVPANRIGYGTYSATQLKLMQEVITIAVFCGFAVLYLGERLKWNHFAAFACVLAAVFFARLDTSKESVVSENSQRPNRETPQQP